LSESIVWIDPDGATATFSKIEFDLRGRFFPSAVVDEEQVPGQPGGRLRNVRHGPLEFAMPVWVQGGSQTALRTALRALVLAMDPTRGVGTIRVTAPGGDQRDLSCICVDGLSVVEKLGETSNTMDQRLVLVFRAHDPYWRSTSNSVRTYSAGSSTATFFPFFPLRLSSSEVFAADTVDNVGDVQTWPVWTATGPMTALVLKNLTTGEALTLTVTLTSGETATIDTDAKTLTKNDGTNLFPYLDWSSVLWALRRGSNSIQVELNGGGGSSSVQLSYPTQYLSP
jgi:hypothetical protein